MPLLVTSYATIYCIKQVWATFFSRTMLIKLNAICINHLSIFTTIFVSDYLIDCKESMDDRETKKKLTN